MQPTNILYISCVMFALLVSSALAPADEIGMSNLQSSHNGMDSDILDPAVATSVGSTIFAFSQYQNSGVSQEQVPSSAALNRGTSGTLLDTMASSALPEPTDGLIFPALAGATPSSGAFVDPIAFCEGNPSPPPSPTPEPGTLVLLGSGLLISAIRQYWYG